MNEIQTPARTGATSEAGVTEPSEPAASAPLPPIVARFRPVHWIAAVIGVLVLVRVAVFLVTNPNWRWDVVGQYLFAPVVLRGLLVTVVLTLVSTALGLAVGVLTAYMRLSSNPTLRIAASAYIWFVRSIPPLVLILLIFFFGALVPVMSIGVPFGPDLLSVPANEVITRFSASVVALGLYLGAYVGEILRGGVLAVPRGQFEAARALGMTDGLLMRRIVSPQAVRVVIPAMANEVITMFKATSLVSVIGAAELLTTVQLTYARTFEIIPMLMVACLWYLLITSIAMLGQVRLERRYGRGYAATPTGPTSLRRVLTLRGGAR